MAAPLPSTLISDFPWLPVRYQQMGGDGITRTVYERDGSNLKLVWCNNHPSNPDPNHRPLSMAGEAKTYTMRMTLAR